MISLAPARSELLPPDGFPLERFFALAIPLADAVASAHSRGVVRRDLKPANVMVTDEEERVKVLDFGAATGDDRRCEDRRRSTSWAAPGAARSNRNRR